MFNTQVYAYGYIAVVALIVFVPIVIKAIKDCSQPRKEPMARFNKR